MFRFFLASVSTFALVQTVLAQTSNDAAATLGRDLAAQTPPSTSTVYLPSPAVTDPLGAIMPGMSDGLMVGAINVNGAREIPRDVFAPAIEPFIGKQAGARQLQAMAGAIAKAARDRGYIFASAVVPRQTVESGTVTVQLDAGAVERIRIVGSKNRQLRRVLDAIVGPAVRRNVLERQLLLAGDIPGITVVSTRYAREGSAATLIVEVAEKRVSGYAGLGNSGSQSLGPARVQLRIDLTGLFDDGDQLTTQLVLTPLQPKELAYGSMRYALGVGNGDTQVGFAAAVGNTKPGDAYSAGRLKGDSLYGAIFVNHALLRSNRASIWANAELAVLRVNEDYDGSRFQHDQIVTLTLSTTMSSRFLGGTLWSGWGIVKGLGVNGTTRAGDPMSSRFGGSGVFTKVTGWADWTRSLSKHWSLRIGTNGQLANRPLLAAQEIAVGGPGFGRAYDYSERFGDNGILGLVELRQQIDRPVTGVDYIQIYGFADGGYIDNLEGGFGNGTRVSAGAGFRAGLGRMSIGVEAAIPVNARRLETNSKAPRVNLTVGRAF